MSRGIAWRGLAGLIALTAAVSPVTAAPVARLTLRGDRLSATVREAAPRDVLAALERAGLRIILRGDLPDEAVSATVDDVDIERGVARLLSGASYVLVYEPATNGGARGAPSLSVIQVLSWPGRRTSTAVAPNPRLDVTPPVANPPLSLRVVESEAAAAPRPADRALALHALAYLGHADRAAPALERALGDPDDAVRLEALELIKDTADGVPFDALARMARADRSPRLRAAALALLAEREDVRAVGELRLGLGDPASEVRERAQALLDDLHLDVASPASRSSARPHPSAGRPASGRPGPGKRL